jgi:hypothetical protein
MRTAHKVTKLMDGLTNEEKIALARDGDQDNTLAREIVARIQHADFLTANRETFSEAQRALIAKYAKLAVEMARQAFDEILRDAVKRRDGSRLRQLADQVERKPVVDPERDYVGTQVEAAKALGQPLPTQAKLRRELRSMFKISEKTADRIFRQFGIAGRRGPSPR